MQPGDFPRRWPEVMRVGEFTPEDGTLIFSLLDYIMDNSQGAIPGESLRKEMEMQTEVLAVSGGNYTIHECFVWSFEERIGTRRLLETFREAITYLRQHPDKFEITATAVMMRF